MSDEAIGQRLDFLETQIQTLIKGQEFIIGSLKRITKKDGDRSKQPLPQKSKQNKRKQPTKNDVSKLLHLPEALQRNIIQFTEDLSFNPTNIPDQLISTECLSEDECATISSKPSSKDQTRLLISKIKARGPQVIEKFLDIIGQDHPHLQQQVNQTLEEITHDHKHKPVCVICVMQSTVDLKDIGDHLWQAKIIPDETYRDIYENESLHRNRTLIWNNIVNSINKQENPSDANQVLINALKAKYSHIVEYLDENSNIPSLSCSCCKRRRVRPKQKSSSISSLTDESNTSERTQSPFSSLSFRSSSFRQSSEDFDESPGNDTNIKQLLEYGRQRISCILPIEDNTEDTDDTVELDQSFPFQEHTEESAKEVEFVIRNQNVSTDSNVKQTSSDTNLEGTSANTETNDSKRSKDWEATSIHTAWDQAEETKSEFYPEVFNPSRQSSQDFDALDQRFPFQEYIEESEKEADFVIRNQNVSNDSNVKQMSSDVNLEGTSANIETNDRKRSKHWEATSIHSAWNQGEETKSEFFPEVFSSTNFRRSSSRQSSTDFDELD